MYNLTILQSGGDDFANSFKIQRKELPMQSEKNIPAPIKNNLLLTGDGKCLNARKCAYCYSKRIFKTHKHSSDTRIWNTSSFYELSKAALLVPQMAAQEAVTSDLEMMWLVQNAVKCSALLVCNSFIFQLVFITLGMNKGTCALLNLNF